MRDKILSMSKRWIWTVLNKQNKKNINTKKNHVAFNYCDNYIKTKSIIVIYLYKIHR